MARVMYVTVELWIPLVLQYIFNGIWLICYVTWFMYYYVRFEVIKSMQIYIKQGC